MIQQDDNSFSMYKLFFPKSIHRFFMKDIGILPDSEIWEIEKYLGVQTGRSRKNHGNLQLCYSTKIFPNIVLTFVKRYHIIDMRILRVMLAEIF